MKSERIAICIFAAFGAFGCEHGPPSESPYAGLESREIKGISPDEVRGYLRGEGMGFALVAELNHYPGPRHVLELADRLQIDATQRRAVEESYRSMKADAERLGVLVVERERELDALFAEARAAEPAVGSLLAEIGRLNGELRLVHLRAHLDMRRVLTSRQIEMYDRLRGYAGDAAGHVHRDHDS